MIGFIDEKAAEVYLSSDAGSGLSLKPSHVTRERDMRTPP